MNEDGNQELTMEEMQKLLEERNVLLATMENDRRKDNENHEAEINSLKKELEELKQNHTAQTEELKKTKELNFTLGRQVNTIHNTVDVEQALHSLYGRKEK